MDITIIGTGNMARGIATLALGAGHAVTLLGDPLTGDVIVPAVWFGSVDDVLARYGDQLNGKVVVDITNPIDVDAFEPLQLEAGSAKASTARVVKACNTTFAGTPADGTVAGQPLDVLIASDDEDAKADMAMQQPLETNYSSAMKVLS